MELLATHNEPCVGDLVIVALGLAEGNNISRETRPIAEVGRRWAVPATGAEGWYVETAPAMGEGESLEGLDPGPCGWCGRPLVGHGDRC